MSAGLDPTSIPNSTNNSAYISRDVNIMEATEDTLLHSPPLSKTAKILLIASGPLLGIALVLNSASVALFCLQKLSFCLATDLAFTSAPVWKAAIWSTVAAATTFAAAAFLLFRQFRLHLDCLATQRTQPTPPTPFIPPLINFAGASPSYAYQMLSTNCIRILELLPSDDSQPISCGLHQVNMESLPRYEALSYTWGTEKPDCAISIDGKRFMVRPNLYYALHVFRPPPAAKSRWLWIDAICINQEDEPEREDQVLKMGFIYSSSWRLLIWLGCEADDSSWAITAITEFAKSMDEGEAATNAWEEAFLSDQSFRRTLNAATALLNRSWFYRSWIVQEYVLSYDKTRLFYCGDKHFYPADFCFHSTRGDIFSKIKERLDLNTEKIVALQEFHVPQLFEDLLSMGASGDVAHIVNEGLKLIQASRLLSINEKDCSALGRGMGQLSRLWLLSRSYEIEAEKYESDDSEPDDNQKSSGGITTGRTEQPIVQHTVHTLQRQLTLLRNMKATDPRDKIYSLLGLFQNPKRDFRLDSHDPNLLIVKYSESILKVYASLVRAIVVPTRRLEIFQECNRIRTNNLPSWVPDWSTNDASNLGDVNYRCKASSETNAQFSFSDDLSVLTVKGFVWDELRISRAKPLFRWNELKYRHSMETVQVFIEFTARARSAVAHLFDLLRFRRTEPQIVGRIETQALFPVKHVVMCIGFEDDFIQTSRGYFGELENPAFGDHDLICILLGCPFPMVLRKISDHYELRGQIYIDGIMHGEAMACLDTGECSLQDFELH